MPRIERQIRIRTSFGIEPDSYQGIFRHREADSYQGMPLGMPYGRIHKRPASAAAVGTLPPAFPLPSVWC